MHRSTRAACVVRSAAVGAALCVALPVLIGARFKPFYESERGKDLGVFTWPSEAWKIGGGTAWGFVSYDPEANLI